MQCCTKMLIALIVLVTTSAWALTPPIDESTLMKQADLVIKGEVIDIKCAPNAFEQRANAAVTHYIATVQVNTVKKGRWPGRTIPVRFREVRYVKGFVGDADHIFRVGERGYYYLISRGDGDWWPINWSAAIVKRQGEGPLPFCK